MNHFKNVYDKCKEAGLRVIASRYASKAGFKGWADYKTREPLPEVVEEWKNLERANVDLITGEPSGVIALDFDCDDPELIEMVEHLFPPSICEKRGAKGWTRFYKFSPSFSESVQIKARGKVVFEVLSNDRKTTIPPSKHPNGMDYEWVGKPLWECVDDLDMIGPLFIANVKAVLAQVNNSWEMENKASGKTIKIINGRNDALSSHVGVLLSDNMPLDEAINSLVEFDKREHEVPLFTDVNEMPCSEPYTNALQFYVNHLVSFNSRNLKDNKNPVVPLLPSAVNEKHREIIELGKSLPRASEKVEASLPLADVSTALGKLQLTILENSYVEQPAFAVSASLALMATVLSRKVVFEGVSPNLYLLNIAPSGSGKDAPQQVIKRVMYNTDAKHLLGAGDYVSDASLTDNLGTNPVRLDIMDEVSGLFNTINNADAAYNRKMAEVYCELFSCSNDVYLGRQTAEGRKGNCIRPNVNILGSTTPAAFRNSINRLSIENGLLSRFLIFHGSVDTMARRLTESKPFDEEMMKIIDAWSKFWPVDLHGELGTASQRYLSIPASKSATELLDVYFHELENFKLELDESDIRRPIVRRLYQQMIKISTIHACSRQVPGDTGKHVYVDAQDVEYARKVVDYHYKHLYHNVVNNLHESKHQQQYMGLLNVIPSDGFISKMELANRTLHMNKRYRDSLLEELQENGHILIDHKKVNEINTLVFQRIR